MCHVRVNDRYRVWHDACHLDDARMAPVGYNHFDGYVQGPTTLTRFEPGQHVPGLDCGGWHDAGDDDLRIESQAATVHGLVQAWEAFAPRYDNTTVDQAGRVVEILRPDGKPDILQQVEHGVLTVAGSHQALGRFYRGMIVPTLRQYVQVGDFAAQTDNAVYEPGKAAGVPPPIGTGVKGSPDDRWVFTEQNPRRELAAAAALAAAARALRGFNDPLAAESLRIAEAIWNGAPDDAPAAAQGGKPVRPSPKIGLAVELLRTTNDRRYAEYLSGQADAIVRNFRETGWVVGPALPLIGDAAFTQRMTEAARVYRDEVAQRERKTPYGVPYEPDIWGAGWGIQRFGMQQYFLHTAFPDIFPNRADAARARLRPRRASRAEHLVARVRRRVPVRPRRLRAQPRRLESHPWRQRVGHRAHPPGFPRAARVAVPLAADGIRAGGRDDRLPLPGPRGQSPLEPTLTRLAPGLKPRGHVTPIRPRSS